MAARRLVEPRGKERDRAAAVVAAALALMSHSPDRAGRILAGALGKMAKSTQQRMVADWLKSYLAPGSPGAHYIQRLTRQIHPNVRKRFLAGFISNLFFRDPEITLRMRQELGINPPNMIIISPSMRCNLRCSGCFTGEYDRKDDLPYEVVDRVLTEAESLGIHTFTILGGEPFLWPHLFELCETHRHAVFQVYTNATLIDDEVADRLVEVGNIAPCVSIEGLRELTDARRGRGTYDKAIAAMDRLRERGVLFAFSVTATRLNLDEILSDEFIDLMVEKGALYGWYFAYMPIGLNPDLSLMPTPEERLRLRDGIIRIRHEKPILVADFWGDGPLTGGCLAAGRKYIHINNHGDVEPCVFAHFAVDNIKETSLLEALGSDFFRGLRRLQPFGHDLLRPCPIIDHPGVMRRMVEKYGAYPTHPGAESINTELQPGLRRYAAEVRDLYAPVWEREYQNWAKDWLSTDDEWQARFSRGYDADVEVEEPIPTS